MRGALALVPTLLLLLALMRLLSLWVTAAIYCVALECQPW
jgi:hypothetical protein